MKSKTTKKLSLIIALLLGLLFVVPSALADTGVEPVADYCYQNGMWYQCQPTPAAPAPVVPTPTAVPVVTNPQPAAQPVPVTNAPSIGEISGGSCSVPYSYSSNGALVCSAMCGNVWVVPNNACPNGPANPAPVGAPPASSASSVNQTYNTPEAPASAPAPYTSVFRNGQWYDISPTGALIATGATVGYVQAQSFAGGTIVAELTSISTGAVLGYFVVGAGAVYMVGTIVYGLTPAQLSQTLQNLVPAELEGVTNAPPVYAQEATTPTAPTTTTTVQTQTSQPNPEDPCFIIRVLIEAATGKSLAPGSTNYFHMSQWNQNIGAGWNLQSALIALANSCEGFSGGNRQSPDGGLEFKLQSW